MKVLKLSRYSNAVRQAIYIVECPLHVISDGAHINRSTLSNVMSGRKRTRKETAQALTDTLCGELDKQVAFELSKVERLKALKAELLEAFESEYMGGACHGG